MQLKTNNIIDDEIEKFIKEINSVNHFFYAVRLFHQKIIKNNKKLIIFFGEITWLSKYSGFLTSLTHSWNEYFSLNNVKMILSGSVIGWIKKNIIEDKNGLHGRVTHKIHLHPFDLNETKSFFKNTGLSEHEIKLYFLCFGGVPYYLNFIDVKKSFNQNIEFLFKKNNILHNELKKFCLGLFSEKKEHEKILRLLSDSKNKALSIEDIAKKLNKENNASFYLDIKDLLDCDLIKQNFNFEKNNKKILYSINDSFIYFYCHYLEKNNFQINESNFHIFCGYAFELACFNDGILNHVKNELNISGMNNIEKFYFQNKKSQIDFVIKRPDKVLMLIECKFYNQPFVVNNEFIQDLIIKKENMIRDEKYKNSDLSNYSIKHVIITVNGFVINKNCSPEANNFLFVTI